MVEIKLLNDTYKLSVEGIIKIQYTGMEICYFYINLIYAFLYKFDVCFCYTNLI